MLQAMMTLMNLSWLGASSSQGTQSIILTSRRQGCFKWLSLPKNKVVCLNQQKLGRANNRKIWEGNGVVLINTCLAQNKRWNSGREGKSSQGKTHGSTFSSQFPSTSGSNLFLSKEIYAFHILPLPFSQVLNHVFYRIFELKQLTYHSK